MLKRLELLNGFQGKDFKERERERAVGVCDQLMNCRRAGVRGLPQRKLGCGFQGTKGWMLSRKQFPTLTTESFCCARPIGAYMEKHCQEIITLFFFKEV